MRSTSCIQLPHVELPGIVNARGGAGEVSRAIRTAMMWLAGGSAGAATAGAAPMARTAAATTAADSFLLITMSPFGGRGRCVSDDPPRAARVGRLRRSWRAGAQEPRVPADQAGWACPYRPSDCSSPLPRHGEAGLHGQARLPLTPARRPPRGAAGR